MEPTKTLYKVTMFASANTPPLGDSLQNRREMPPNVAV